MFNSKDGNFTQILDIFYLFYSLQVWPIFKKSKLYVCYNLVLRIRKNILSYTGKVICTTQDEIQKQNLLIDSLYVTYFI
jgi:hypothetical protein